MGRSKYLKPVYSSLQNSGQHDLGVQWYNENKNFYHPVAATSVYNILYPPTVSQVPDHVTHKEPSKFGSLEQKLNYFAGQHL